MTEKNVKVAYLLHRFPGNTDTFIKREIKWLMQAGLELSIISVWTPKPSETTEASLVEWRPHTQFLMPQSAWRVAAIAVGFLLRKPYSFLSAVALAWQTSKSGLKGLAMQSAYLLEAVLAAKIVETHGITHLHNHIGDQSGTVTMLAAKLTNIGYSITFHGWPVFFDADNAKVGVKCNRAVFTRSISYFCRSQLMFFAGSRDATHFKIVRCGLELGNYPFRQPGKKMERLLCVARMSFEKGIGFLLESVKVLRDNGAPVMLHLAGEGEDRGALEAMSKLLGIEAHVKFLGHLNEAGVRKELNEADVFVLPSFVEGVPVSAMEAMAVGVPVVATNVGGTSELVDHGRSGFLVRPSDPHAIADAVVRLKEDPALVKRMVMSARKIVETDYDGSVEFAKLKNHFDTYGLKN